jgi:hypothetical protein
MQFEKKFEQKGTWAAYDVARQWLKESGYSYGSSSVDGPVGILKGDFCISKWRNMTPKERSQLDGTLSGELREGPVVIRLKVAPA